MVSTGTPFHPCNTDYVCTTVLDSSLTKEHGEFSQEMFTFQEGLYSLGGIL